LPPATFSPILIRAVATATIALFAAPEIERTYRQKAADPLLAPFLKLKEDYA